MSTQAPRASILSTPPLAAVLLLLLACGDPTDPPPPEVLDLQAGGSTTCALLEGGDLWCWGWRVGAEVEAVQPTPAPAAENLTVASFTLGSNSACVVDESQATYCWGYWFPIDVSELYGDEPTLLQDSIPLQTLDTHFGHGCGVTDEARLLCWGSNVLGKRGQGTPVVELGSTTPNFVVGTERYRAVATGRLHTCGLLEDEGVTCWGEGSVLGATSPAVVETEEACFYQGVSCAWSPVRLPLSNVDQVALGSEHSCARSGGGVYCWGSNFFHQMGDGTMNTASSPITVSLPEAVTDVAAGALHTCALGISGIAYCWGNAGPWLGHGQGDRPSPVGGDLRFVRLVAGQVHTCGLTDGREVYCWGQGDGGLLGDGAGTASVDPVRVVPSWDPRS
jgi:alpha-tubulin suppressor-like RCC1 family protein